MPARREPLAEDVWTLRFYKRLLGVTIGRVVTVLRLRDGRLVIHSTGPFAPDDVAWLHSLGEPSWRWRSNCASST